MKRYRILGWDLDGRAHLLQSIQDQWDDDVKAQHRATQARIIAGLKLEYGEAHFDQKLRNFVDLGAKPFSIVAFHNRFFDQARNAFVHCQYYPALTGVCALGERVLNHLVLRLRERFRGSRTYKSIYRKDSFDNWVPAIDALSEWEVLTERAQANFRRLAEQRNAALHFNPEVDHNDRSLALESLRTFAELIDAQFAAFATLPWILPAPGEAYIRKDWERKPFVELVYVPNCARVGYRHVVTHVMPWRIEDPGPYADGEISDEEFLRLRQEAKLAP